MGSSAWWLRFNSNWQRGILEIKEHGMGLVATKQKVCANRSGPLIPIEICNSNEKVAGSA